VTDHRNPGDLETGDSRHSAGRWAEQAALEYLADCGLTCLARNHRSRFGEIDLVMRDGEVLVFVEVRFRRDDRFGGGVESVTRAKRRRLLAAARHYLGQLRQARLPPCRFDVVSVSRPNYRPHFEWIRDAFTEDG
jgi:putative endonuclease